MPRAKRVNCRIRAPSISVVLPSDGGAVPRAQGKKKGPASRALNDAGDADDQSFFAG
jgi:hypothetical protein